MPDKNINEVPRQAREYYEKGVVALERNTLDPAIHYMTESLLIEPGFLKARQMLRVAQIKKFKTGGAMSKMFGSVTGSPALAKAMTSIKKDPAKAIEAAEKCLASNPYNLQALKVLSEAAEAMDLPLTAVFAHETAREANPQNLTVLMELGRLYQACNQSTKARECYEKVLELKPGHAEAFQGLKDSTANEAMKQGKWENAQSYRDIVKDTKEAQSLEQASRIFKDEDVIRNQMDETYKLTQEQPENVSNWKKLGDLAAKINLFDYAIDCYKHAFELTRGADGTLEKLISDVKMKKLTAAIREKEDLLKADPENEALKQELAAMNQEKEQTFLAECEARAKRYPNDQEIRFELARTYFRNSLIDKAISEFQTAASNPKNKIACTFWLGKCFLHKGMLDMAAQRFKSAADQTPTMDNLKKDILYNLGTLQEQMGKKNEAIEQFKIIYDVDVNYRDVAKKIEDYYKGQSGA